MTVICYSSSICVIRPLPAPPGRLSWCASGHTLIYKLRLLLALEIRCSCTRTVNRRRGMLHAPSHGFWHPSSHKGWRRDVENQGLNLGVWVGIFDYFLLPPLNHFIASSACKVYTGVETSSAEARCSSEPAVHECYVTDHCLLSN